MIVLDYIFATLVVACRRYFVWRLLRGIDKTRPAHEVRRRALVVVKTHPAGDPEAVFARRVLRHVDLLELPPGPPIVVAPDPDFRAE